MKTKLLWLLFALATTVHAALPDAALAPALQPLKQQSQAAHMTAVVVSRLHYKPTPLDDAMSQKILEHYLNVLDADKFFFTKADVDQLTADYGARLDETIIDGDLSIPFAIFKLHAQRMNDRFSYARSLLKTGFDFAQKESYPYERKKKPWLESEKELNELWRKRVKNDWLLLKLADQDDKAIVETLDKRYANSQKRVTRITSEDVFQAFMNAYTTAIDPHSNYLSPRAAEDFGISMSLSLFGIGASLSQKDDYTVITALIAGGPAVLSGQLKAGDRIVAVGQGGGALTEIIGGRLSDAVALIRGAADTTVRLAVLPADAAADGQQKFVTLVRKKITLDDQSAKTKVLTVTAAGAREAKGAGKPGDRQAGAGPSRRVGVITLPSFYRDFEGRQKGDREYRSAARDVARALANLQRDQVDGVLLDLRDNGGGSLIEAVETAALFIGSGPIVQQRDTGGEIKVEHSARSGLAWNGPLGVLINRGSASASEIFAAAIQDYQRGVVIGEPSFGKGTVQALISLDELARKDKPVLGELKLTVGQFFRVNGGTTQRRGVQPDIALPTLPMLEDFGEASFDNALPWLRIKPLAYTPAGDLSRLLPVLERQHQDRVKHSKDFRNLQDNIGELQRLRERTVISLNEDERRRERDALSARIKSRQAQGGAAADELIQAADGAEAAAKPPGGTTLPGADTGDTARDPAASKDAVSDLSLLEAARIVGDAAALLAPTMAIATSASPAPKLGRNNGQRLDEAAGRAGAWKQSQRDDYGPMQRP